VDKIINLIERLDKEISLENNLSDKSLLGGSAGIALFYSYKDLILNDGSLQKAAYYLENSLDKLDKVNDYSFSNGIAGILACYQHLINEELVTIDSEEFLSKVDKILIEVAIDFLEQKNYDLFHGAIGIGIYFLERRIYNKSTKYLKVIIDKLFEIIDSKSNLWIFYPHLYNDPTKELYAIGYVHGIPSILSFLSNSHDLLSKKQTTIIQNCILKILSFQKPKSNISRFPLEVSINNFQFDKKSVSRLAFCNGDLGTTYGLTISSINLFNTINPEFNILYKSLQNRNDSKSQINDASLCHGISGVILIYLMLNKVLNTNNFDSNISYWLTKLFHDTKDESNLNNLWYSGFDVVKNSRVSIRKDGLLEGFAGIALVLLTMLDTKKNNWIRLFSLNETYKK